MATCAQRYLAVDAHEHEPRDLDATHIDLHLRTFHPALPGLAFAGLWDQAGPYFPPIELQARWIAYTWSGAVPHRLRMK